MIPILPVTLVIPRSTSPVTHALIDDLIDDLVQVIGNNASTGILAARYTCDGVPCLAIAGDLEHTRAVWSRLPRTEWDGASLGQIILSEESYDALFK